MHRIGLLRGGDATAAVDRNGGFRIILFVSILIVLIKFVLISRNEIVSMPYDAEMYVRHAATGLGQLGAIGYPLWLWSVKQVGMPQRLAIEVLHSAACVWFSLVVSRRIGVFLSVLLVGILILNPGTYYLFDQALTDPFFVCLTLIALGVSIVLLSSGDETKVRYGSSAALGAVLGAMSVTRSESPLTLGWMAWLFLIAFLWESRATRKRLAFERSLKSLLITAIVCLTITAIPNAYHYATKGVWASAFPTMPSHLKLLGNLAAIDTGEEDIRRVPISRKARELAYQVSPSLAKLRQYIERPDNPHLRVSREAGLPEGEIGGGWIWHVFTAAAMNVLEGDRSIARVDAFWKQVNRELDEAFESGALKRRFVLHPLLGGGLVRPFSDLPQGIMAAFDTSFRFTPYQPDLGQATAVFDAVCNRRSWLVTSEPDDVTVAGWALADSAGSQLSKVQIGRSSAPGEWVDAGSFSRADVDQAFSKDLRKQVRSLGFSGEMHMADGAQAWIRYVTAKGEVLHQEALRPELRGKMEVTALANGGKLYRGFDQYSIRHLRKFNGFLTGVIGWEGWQAVKWVFFLGVAAPFALLLVSWKRPGLRNSETYLVSLLVAGLVAQRLAFYGLINENGWALESRYVSSVFGMTSVVLVCLVALVVPAKRGPGLWRNGL